MPTLSAIIRFNPFLSVCLLCRLFHYNCTAFLLCRQAPETGDVRAKCELGKLQDGILRIFGSEGEEANVNEVFRLLKTILKNYKIVIWYAVTVYKSKII